MQAALLRPETMIPDLLGFAPQVRPVLDRYGLRGCGGALGPMETLAFFAAAHDVPLKQLLAELRSAFGEVTKSTDSAPHAADRIYRLFFLTGIVIVLSLGAAWGAYILLQIAAAGRFTAVGIHEVNAHGHAQIFGWVGLFVMGFAYQAFPRFKHTDLAFPRFAYASGLMMLGGILIRSLGEPLVAGHSSLYIPVLAAAWLEVFAIALFAGIIFTTWRRSGKTLAFYDSYIASALLWFIVQAIYDALYLGATLTASDREELLRLVAQWQGPLREMQIHGFALLMILGVSQRLFHHFYGFPAPSERLSRWVLLILNLAVIGEVLGLILMRSQGHAWALLWYVCSFVLALSVTILVVDWKIFSTPRDTDRSLKFMRAGYVWLFVSLGMLLFLPVYQFALLPAFAPDVTASQAGFSHAYYGAIRHAITVGFVSLMIVGVAAKVVPTLNGVDVRVLGSLWGPFLLLNIGCSLRVIGQVMTDLTSDAFPFAGASGLLEVTGLALWGWHLGRLMLGWGTTEAAAGIHPLLADQPIDAQHYVGDVLDRYPKLLSVFMSFGFKPLASAWLRNTVARRVTIARACQLMGVSPEDLLTQLNQERAHDATNRISLLVVH